MVSDIHWGLGTDPLWMGGLVFPWQYMAAGPIIPCGLPPAGSWLWAGGRGEWRKGMEAEALQGLQSLPQLGPGFSVMTRRPTPHSKRHFPCEQPQMAQLCIGAQCYPGSAPQHPGPKVSVQQGAVVLPVKGAGLEVQAALPQCCCCWQSRSPGCWVFLCWSC